MKYTVGFACKNYLYSICLLQTDLHLHNFLLRIPNLDSLGVVELYERYSKPYEVPIRRIDGKPSMPHAPPHVIHPIVWNMPANEIESPEVILSGYGTSFVISQTPSPTLHTPALYAPPEEFFKEPISIPTAADVWTLGVVLYEVLGERALFETFAWDPDDIIGEMINTLGRPPARWWNSWVNRAEFLIQMVHSSPTSSALVRLNSGTCTGACGIWGAVRRRNLVNGMLLAVSLKHWRICSEP